MIKRAREPGVQNIAVTHAMVDVPGLSLEQMKQAAAMGAYMEYVYLNHLMGPHAHQGWMRHWKQVSFSDLAKAVKAVGAEHFILSSDLGQSGNPTHPDGYAKMVVGLKGEGVSQADLDLMTKKNPTDAEPIAASIGPVKAQLTEARQRLLADVEPPVRPVPTGRGWV